jgi:hypothetical protein
MTSSTFENDNDVNVYAFETVISYARRTQQIFVAQCIWWLAGIVRLEQGLVNHIDNLHGSTVISKEQCSEEVRNPAVLEASIFQDSQPEESKKDQQDIVLQECKEFLRDSGQFQRVAALKSKGDTRTGRINPTPISSKALRNKDRPQRQQAIQNREGKCYDKTEGISGRDIQRRKGVGECLHCAWHADRKGTHRVKDCVRPIKLDKGTSSYPKAKEYQQLKLVNKISKNIASTDTSEEDSSREESSDDPSPDDLL